MISGDDCVRGLLWGYAGGRVQGAHTVCQVEELRGRREHLRWQLWRALRSSGTEGGRRAGSAILRLLL